MNGATMTANPHRGRPLVFLASVFVSWALVRGIMLYPAGEEEPRPSSVVAREEAAPPPVAEPAPVAAPASLVWSVRPSPILASEQGRPVALHLPIRSLHFRTREGRAELMRASLDTVATFRPPLPSLPFMAEATGPDHSHAPATAPTPTASPPRPPARSNAGSAIRGSAWLLWRRGSGSLANGLVAPHYGGSQAGARLALPIKQSGAEIYARGAAALARPGKEVAVGLAYRPVRKANITVAVEQRFALDSGARTAPAILAYGGFDPKPLGAGFTLDGYAQGGVVGVKNPVLFADAAVTAKREFARIGPVPLSLGARVSGGAQDKIARLDVGPLLEADLKAPLGKPLRLSLEWRERIAGEALPSSGPALILATDF